MKNISKKIASSRFILLLIGTLAAGCLIWFLAYTINSNSDLPSDEATAVKFTTVNDAENKYRECTGQNDCIDPSYAVEGRRIYIQLGVRNTGGYEVSVKKVEAASNELRVYIEEIAVGNFCNVTQAITNPSTIIDLEEEVKKPIKLIPSVKRGPDCS